MSSSTTRPSIFTPRDAFKTLAAESQRTPARPPRTSSPFGRLGKPDAPERAFLQAAAEAAPFVLQLPQDRLARGANADAGGSSIEPSEHTSRPSVWDSFRAAHQADTPSPDNHSSTGRSASVNQKDPQTPSGASCSITALGRSDSTSKKRHADVDAEQRPPGSEPSYKRPRLRPPYKHYLPGYRFATADLKRGVEPPSPLFFSNSPQPRPSLPPRFSSSEAAARMLSKARTEDSHVKTVSLARGVVSASGSSMSPSGGPPVPPSASSRPSVDRSATGRSTSPDAAVDPETTSLLSSIGLVELLEQDDRPTFIVDLAEGSNYGSMTLRPCFVNRALRSHTGLEAMATGRNPASEVSPGSPSHVDFRTWLLASPSESASSATLQPFFLYGGVRWSCSTLRRRLRIVSGSLQASPFRTNEGVSVTTAEPAVPLQEPTDYFGPSSILSESNETSDSSSFGTRTIVPTIEQSNAAQSVLTPDAHMSDRILPVHADLAAATQLLPEGATYVPTSPKPTSESSSGSSVDRIASHITVVPADSPSFDWTRLPVTDSMPAHIRFARSIDWASTSLGPIEHWSSDLRQMCNLIMASPHPAAMYWGDDLIAIYNEAYILLAGQKHPSLMGQSYRVAWAEIWPEVEPVFRNAKLTGEATMKDDDCLFIRRNDSNTLEETYFSWSIIPMVGGDGTVMGLYNPAFEKTRRKIAERRMLTLREVGERTACARDVNSFWAQVLGSFEFNEFDSPFLLLYSVENEQDSDSSSIHSNSVIASRACKLEGTLGVTEGHPAAPPSIDLKSGQDGFGPVFREVMKTDKPVMLEVGSKDLPSSLLEKLDFRGFGDPVKSVTVCPIHPTTGEAILGFLVLGVNPRRPYDDDYLLFVQLLSRQLATSLASVVLFEEEIRRGQKAAKLAALDRIELSEQLAARTQEAIESETKFTRMAEFAPVGMFIANSSGKITFANDTWYDISRIPKNSNMADTWMEFVLPADWEKVKQLWEDLVVGTQPVSAEFRFKAPLEDKHGHRNERWVLFSGYPEKYEDGRLKSVFGSFTNISQQKWAEGIQTRKMEEAVELKRQQENFIDITSHEMRNPLSAILQCSDEIAATLIRFKNSGESNVPDEMVASCLDAAQIINLCSQHQKRIVDDILTLSKLDSQLLLVTPVDAQPLTVVQRALKMHEGELSAADIQLKFIVDQSYRDLELDWVRFDPSRVLQVLINLTTNAIKFTGGEKKRVISVTISASRIRPSERPDALVKYFPIRRQGQAMIDEKDWGDGDKVFVHFAVRDTGRGLNPEEKKMLFMRFSQASPRTHVQYGGSGLGLFISRELTELQGGEIGVESESGKGSTFAFYVLARKSVAPPEGDSTLSVAKSSARSKSMPTAKTSASQPLSAPSANGSAASAARQPQQHTLRRLKTLIVEDNLVNQRVLQKQLKNIGTEVHLANHGGEALEKLKQSTYWAGSNNSGSKRIELGVLLMDQEMPIMDGLTCTRKIRELEKEGKLTGHVPIIAVTANARAEQVQDALGAGMDDVVSKPFRIPELVPKIEELMARYPSPPS